MNMYNYDPESATKKELFDAMVYYRTIAIGQAAHISSMEGENEDLINDVLKLAKENDLMTQGMFESPYAYGFEVHV